MTRPRRSEEMTVVVWILRISRFVVWIMALGILIEQIVFAFFWLMEAGVQLRILIGKTSSVIIRRGAAEIEVEFAIDPVKGEGSICRVIYQRSGS